MRIKTQSVSSGKLRSELLLLQSSLNRFLTLPVDHQLVNFKPYITEFLASKFDLNVKIINGDASPADVLKSW